jgi:hypothetical protein
VLTEICYSYIAVLNITGCIHSTSNSKDAKSGPINSAPVVLKHLRLNTMQYENIFIYANKFVILMDYNTEVRSLINAEFLNYHLQISVHLIDLRL